MAYVIRAALQSDVSGIQALYQALGRPPRETIPCSDFLVAIDGDALVGCAGVTLFADGGYLYGLAVSKSYQRRGIGSDLTIARIERVHRHGNLAVVLAMFWNVRFFKRLGFQIVKKSTLPMICLSLPDFNSSVYRRSTTLTMRVGGSCDVHNSARPLVDRPS